MNPVAKDADSASHKLQKVLAQTGLGSRRDMEEWIAAGRVRVNGTVAALGARVQEGDRIEVDGRPVRWTMSVEVPRILLYHKPEGEIVSRDDPEQRASVFDQLPHLRGAKWIAIGRLDFNSSGLLLFTTSGELANQLMHPRFEVEREYAVRTLGEATPDQLQQLTRGVDLDDGPAHVDAVRDDGGTGTNHWYRVILREGRNREVRRIFAAIGLTVSRLMRVRYGIVNMPPRLKRGNVLELDAAQVRQVCRWAGYGEAAEGTGGTAGEIKFVEAKPKGKAPGRPGKGAGEQGAEERRPARAPRGAAPGRPPRAGDDAAPRKRARPAAPPEQAERPPASGAPADEHVDPDIGGAERFDPEAYRSNFERAMAARAAAGQRAGRPGQGPRTGRPAPGGRGGPGGGQREGFRGGPGGPRSGGAGGPAGARPGPGGRKPGPGGPRDGFDRRPDGPGGRRGPGQGGRGGEPNVALDGPMGRRPKVTPGHEVDGNRAVPERGPRDAGPPRGGPRGAPAAGRRGGGGNAAQPGGQGPRGKGAGRKGPAGGAAGAPKPPRKPEGEGEE